MALQQDIERLAAAIRQLPEKQRILIERAYFGELTHSEIAAGNRICPLARSNPGLGWLWNGCATQ